MWDPRDESASKVYFDSVAQRAMFLFPSSNTDARVLPARTTLCPRVYGERRKWLKSSRTIYVSYVVSSKWKIQRESTVLIKLCLETPLSGVVVDYRIAINVWGGGRESFVEFSRFYIYVWNRSCQRYDELKNYFDSGGEFRFSKWC